MKFFFLLFLLPLISITLRAQMKKDSVRHFQLKEVTVTDIHSITGMGYLGGASKGVIYSGKKTEVLLLDSLTANTIQNNPREVLGRIPGANFSETSGGGFPSNGIAFRGLNPSQSIETNTRQNGYNITADLFGYPESYYLPPLQAVDRVEVTRGAASLAFGAQFGGTINYIVKRINRQIPFGVGAEQTVGSFGLVNSFLSLGGNAKRISYYGFIQNQYSDGSRPNARYRQTSIFGNIEYTLNEKITLGVEYTLFRNLIQMPGGLADAQFKANPNASYRARNWLESPWNLLAATLTDNISKRTTLSEKVVFNASARNLVWKNEDGGPQSPDSNSAVTLQPVNREVQREMFRNITSETRLTSHYFLGNVSSFAAAGIRLYYGHMLRKGGGTGTTGSAFDLTLVDPKYGYDLIFKTLNIAPFIENSFSFGKRLTITPGLRFEFLQSTINGYTPDSSGADLISKGAKTRKFLVAGLGMQYNTGNNANLYLNISQAYRPVTYEQLTPLGSIATVDPLLKDAKGYNADGGLRGSIKNYLNFDVGVFLLYYGRRIGIIEENTQLPFITNIGNSRHEGIESYVEFSPVKAFLGASRKSSLSLFNSLGYTHARYVSGTFSGNTVEYAPTIINRAGVTLGHKTISASFVETYTSRQFGDAANSRAPSPNAVVGILPGFWVSDLSSKYSGKIFFLKAGVNNLLDRHYFTLRTVEYPGPGIIPAQRRTFYVSLGINSLAW